MASCQAEDRPPRPPSSGQRRCAPGWTCNTGRPSARCWTSGRQPARRNSDSWKLVPSPLGHAPWQGMGCGSAVGRCIGPLQAADIHPLSAKDSLQAGFKLPLRAGAAAKQVQAERAVFREGMAGEMRFGEQAKSGDATRLGKLPPLSFAARMQVEVADDLRDKVFQCIETNERLR